MDSDRGGLRAPGVLPEPRRERHSRSGRVILRPMHSTTTARRSRSLRSRKIATSLFLGVVSATSAVAQSVVVACDVTGATLLVEADLATGVMSPGTSFVGGAFSPRALTVDPFDGRVLVALNTGPGTSRVMRVDRSGAWSRVLADVVGEVVALGVGPRGTLQILTGGPSGGVWSVARTGGVPVMQTPYAGLVAAHFHPGSTSAVAVHDRPATGQAVVGLDLVTGAPFFGPAPLSYPAGVFATGVVDLPTGAIRQAVSDSLGGVGLLELGGVWTPLSVTPVLPPGGARRLLPGGFSLTGGLDVLALGGSSGGDIVSIEVFGPVAGARRDLVVGLPGVPVDFAVVPDTRGTVQFYGASCASGAVPAPQWQTTTLPRLGVTIALGVQAAPSSPAALLFGVDDQRIGGGLLPVTLPGGCSLLQSTDFALPAQTDPLGRASILATVSTTPSTVGLRLFAQWVVGARLSTSDAVVLHVGP